MERLIWSWAVVADGRQTSKKYRSSARMKGVREWGENEKKKKKQSKCLLGSITFRICKILE